MSPGTKSSEARAPVYGLRLTIGAGKVMVRTLDSRGRGRAVGALFVPVVQMDERLRVDANSSFVAILDEPATSSTASPPTRKTKIPRELSKKLVPEEEDLVAPRLFAVPLD